MFCQDVFILETGMGIYVWQGKNATRNEKAQALKDAQVIRCMHSYNNKIKDINNR